MMKRLSGGNRILTALLLIVCVSAFGFADSFWEGSVTTANYGDLPNTGFYGASNAFPPDTDVIVTNTENGKSVEVKIVKRLDTANVFIALSSEAGEKIGLTRGKMINGSISVKTPEKTGNQSELVNSRDPEVNPAGGEDKELSLIQEYIDTELSGKSVQKKIEPSPETNVPEKSPEPAVVKKKNQPPIKKTPEKNPAEVSSSSPDVIILTQGVPAGSTGKPVPFPVPLIAQKAIKENEQPSVYDFPVSIPELTGKKTFRENAFPALSEVKTDTPLVLSMIARPEEKKFTPLKMSLPIVAAERKTQTAGKPDIIIAREPKAVQPARITEPSALPEIASESIPVETVETVKAVPKKEPVVHPAVEAPLPPVIPSKMKTVAIVLEPAQPKPPVPVKTINPSEEKPEPSAPVSEAANRPAEEVIAPGSTYTMTTKLEKGAFYLQLGVYDEEFSAKDLAVTLSGHYPVTVLVASKPEKSRYKVMVGPLNQDEGGALLFNFRARGYKDAFLRRGIK